MKEGIKEIWLAYRPDRHKRKKRYSPADLTKTNFEYWQRTKWPTGIKIDLARQFPIPIPENEHLVFFQETQRGEVLFVSRFEKNGTPYTRTGRYFFPHPKTTYPALPSWQRGGTFSIPASAASSWRDGISKLFSLPPHARITLRGLYLFSITYGMGEGEGADYNHIRFTVDLFYGTWWYKIQAWRQIGDSQWPTRRIISCPIEKPAFFKALDDSLAHTEKLGVDILEAAPDVTEVKLNDNPDLDAD